jgi:adenylate cyclase
MRPTLKSLPLILASLVLILLIGAQLRDPQWFAALRNRVFDGYMAVFPGTPRGPIAVVDIDTQSLARHGPWPWSTETLAALLDGLAASGAVLAALAVIPGDPDTCPSPSGGQAASRDDPSPPARGRLPTAPPSVIGFALADRGGSPSVPPRRVGLVTLGEPRDLHTALPQTLLPAEVSLSGAAGVGALNVFPDADGRLRRVPLLVQMGDALYPSLLSETFRLATAQGSYLVRFNPDGVEPPISLKLGPVVIPLTRDAEVWLHYGPRHALPSVSAGAVLEGRVPPGTLERRIVLIGVSAPGIGAAFNSPLGEPLAPAEIYAQGLGQLLSGTQPARPGWVLGAEAALGAAGSLILVLISLWRPGLWLVIPGALMVAGAYLGGLLLFRAYALLIDGAMPALTIGAVLAVLTLAGYVIAERERRWIQRAFSSYVSPNLVSHLVRHPEELRLRGERRECSFVMTDLAGFTAMVERFPPEELVDLLNGYLESLVSIVFRFDGTVERIVGDAVSAHFSAPVRQPDHAQRAVDLALAIDRFASEFSSAMQARGVPFGQTRIGVHTGEVIVGNFGGRSHLDYRGFGDPINTTARLESANRHFGTRIAISAETLARCEGLETRPIGELILKGKSRPISVSTPLSADEIRAGLAEAYLKAYRLATRGDAAALAAFQSCAARFPGDGPTRFHLERLRGGLSGVVIPLEK